MALAKDQTVYAQVVLKAASGKTIYGGAQITAATLGDYAPAHETIAAARAGSAAAGLEAGSPVGIGFAVHGTVEAFETLFGVALSDDPKKGVRALQDDASSTYELPLGALPGELAEHLEAVTFSPPPDFGPSGFFEP